MVEQTPEKLWFKRKWYGWGWYPATFEGWVVTLLYVAFIVYLATRLDESLPFKHALGVFFIPLALITVVFVAIAYAKGESPRWQWGKPEGENEKISEQKEIKK